MAEEIELLDNVQDIPVEEVAGIDADNAEDVVIDLSWLSSLEEKLVYAYRTKSSPLTICRVPANIRRYDDDDYSPKIVSIGPIHRGKVHLQAMEKHKWLYLHQVLAFGDCRNTLEGFLKEMQEIETQARSCYSENIYICSEEFVEMMVLDGCFTIFFILQQIGISQTDVLFYGNESMSRFIYLDMLLLENQLPFFVLERLWELIGLQRAELRNGALKSFDNFFSYKLELKSPEEDIIHHLLHLVHLSIKPDSPTRDAAESKQQSRQLWNMIPSATKLQNAGVRFKLKEARSFFEVRFELGLMEMSRLRIYNETNSLFRNFIALGQCFPVWGNHFTTYCCFIDFLVNTPSDVLILSEAEIIRNGLGSDEEVALLFNNLAKDIVWSVDGSYLAELFERVNEYSQRRWSKLRSKLPPEYFGTPWGFISLIAAVIFLILPLIQTFFSVFAYFKPPKP